MRVKRPKLTSRKAGSASTSQLQDKDQYAAQESGVFDSDHDDSHHDFNDSPIRMLNDSPITRASTNLHHSDQECDQRGHHHLSHDHIEFHNQQDYSGHNGHADYHSYGDIEDFHDYNGTCPSENGEEFDEAAAMSSDSGVAPPFDECGLSDSGGTHNCEDCDMPVDDGFGQMVVGMSLDHDDHVIDNRRSIIDDFPPHLRHAVCPDFDKITVMSSGNGPSEFSGDCEHDGSYSEYVETDWRRSKSFSIVSDTDSIVIHSPKHGPRVRCVCVCNKKSCDFPDRPLIDPHDHRTDSQMTVTRMDELLCWWKTLSLKETLPMPTFIRGYNTTPPPTELESPDNSITHTGETKLKLIEIFGSRGDHDSDSRFRSRQNSDDSSHPSVENQIVVETVVRRHFSRLRSIKREDVRHRLRRLRKCEGVSVPRLVFTVLGLVVFLLGATYDVGVKHGVDQVVHSCWAWLKDTYIDFGHDFIKYYSILFRYKNSRDVFENPNVYSPNRTLNFSEYIDFINEKDPTFLYILEGLQLSLQVHFFSLKDTLDIPEEVVSVEDIGPMFLRISFTRAEGLRVKFIEERSNLTFSTPFHVYDIMKLILLSNDLPYFGFHMHDHYKTTPGSLLSMIIDTLGKFKYDTSFLSALTKQILQEKEMKTKAFLKQRNQRNKREINQFLLQAHLKRLENITNDLFLKVPFDTRQEVMLPLPFVKKNVTLRYRHETSNLGLGVYQFVLEKDRHSHHTVDPGMYIPRNNKIDGYGSGNSDDYIYNDNFHEQRHSSSHNKHRWPFNKNALDDGSGSSEDQMLDMQGVVDLEPIFLEMFGKIPLMGRHMDHYPFWVSAPHFLYSGATGIHTGALSQELQFDSSAGSGIDYILDPPDGQQPRLRRATSGEIEAVIVPVDGVTPSESSHGSFIYYHPILGVPINASIGLQLGLRPPAGMLHAHKHVPVLWARLQVEEVPQTLYYIMWFGTNIRGLLMSFLIILGLLIMGLAQTCGRGCCKKTYHLEEVIVEEIPMQEREHHSIPYPVEDREHHSLPYPMEEREHHSLPQQA